MPCFKKHYKEEDLMTELEDVFNCPKKLKIVCIIPYLT